MTNYARGRRLEYDTINALQAHGWNTIRAAGSHGTVDILAWKRQELLAIQCKVDGKLSPAERFQLRNVTAHLPGPVTVLVALRPTVRFREITGPGPKEWVEWALPERDITGPTAYSGGEIDEGPRVSSEAPLTTTRLREP